MVIKLDKDDWGPKAWSFIHHVAMAYPEHPTEEDKHNYKNFYENIKNVLPCKECASNYEKNLERKPIDSALVGNQELFKWTIDIHNMVNVELGKRKYSYEEVFKDYLKDNGNNGNNVNNVVICITGVLLIILIGYLIIKNK